MKPLNYEQIVLDHVLQYNHRNLYQTKKSDNFTTNYVTYKMFLLKYIR